MAELLQKLKKVTAVVLAACMMFSGVNENIRIFAQEAKETAEQWVGEANAEKESLDTVSSSGVEIASMGSVQEKTETDPENSVEEESWDCIQKGEEEREKEDAESGGLSSEVESADADISGEMNDKEQLKEELLNDHEKKDYIILMEDEGTAEEIVEEYAEVTEEDVQEAKEESEGDVQVVVSEMTGETAAEILEEDGVLCVEEDSELKGFTGDILDVGKQDGLFLEETDGLPNDTWNLEMVHADDFDISQKNAWIRVAVLDSGVEVISNAQISGQVNLVENEEEIPEYMQDMTGHGTAVANIIRCISENAKLYSVKVLDEDNVSPLSRIVRGIYWCIDHQMDIINMSLGTKVKSMVLKQAVSDASDAGILMISAAGNGGKEEGINYPAAFDEVIAVGAVDEMAKRCEESAVGNELELVAPGEHIFSEGILGMTIMGNGTSMAVPHVTGIAAILLAKDSKKSPDAIRFLMNQSSRRMGNREEYGNGMPDLSDALEHYDEYMNAYENGKECLLKNTKEIETFEEIKGKNNTFVTAKWGPTKHEGSIDTTKYTNISEKEFDLIKKAAVIPDYINKDKNTEYFEEKYKSKFEVYIDKNGKKKTSSKIYKETLKTLIPVSQHYFHGDNNYIAITAYLYGVARKVKKKMDVNIALDSTTYRGRLQDIEWKKKEKGIIKETVRRVLKYAELHFVPYGDNLTPKEQAAVIFGLSLHVLGDVYAHRTKVPKDSLKNCSSKPRPSDEIKTPSRLYKTEFMNWDKLAEKIMTSKIFMLKLDEGLKATKKYKKINSTSDSDIFQDYGCYTDSINFYINRYKDGTKHAVDYFLETYSQKQDSIPSYKSFCLAKGSFSECCIIRGLKYFTEESYKASEIGENKKYVSYSFLDDGLETIYYNEERRKKVMDTKL